MTNQPPELPLHPDSNPSDTRHSRKNRFVAAAAGILFSAGIGGATSYALRDSPPQAIEQGDDEPAPARITPEVTSDPETGEQLSHTVVASIFGIGEPAGPDNDYITNEDLSWRGGINQATGNPIAIDLFGGIDDASKRRPDGLPEGFTPLHNPYYFALPAGEFTETGLIPGVREKSPWADEASSLASDESLFQGRWVAVSRTDADGTKREAFAQWIDVGPNEEMDHAYVFGDDQPSNTFGLKAGIDISPVAAHDLGFSIQEGGADVT